MENCDRHKTGDRVDTSFYFTAENGYTYEATVTGKIVKRYDCHIGPGFHKYQILFDSPRYPDDKELLVDMMEYDLRFK